MKINSDEAYQDQIESYLNGLLNEEETNNFEEKLKEDPQLAYEVERIRIARSLVKNPEFEEKLYHVNDQNASFERDNEKTRLARLVVVRSFIGFAALLIGIFVYQFFSLNNDLLYKEQSLLKQEDLQMSDNELNKPIIHSFNNKDYNDVINIYENKPDSTSSKNNLLAGLSYLELSKIEKAQECFRKVINHAEEGGDNEFLEEAEYYLGLAFLRSNDIDGCYWYFSKIYHDMGHRYHERISKWFYWKLRIVNFRKKIF